MNEWHKKGPRLKKKRQKKLRCVVGDTTVLRVSGIFFGVLFTIHYGTFQIFLKERKIHEPPSPRQLLVTCDNSI